MKFLRTGIAPHALEYIPVLRSQRQMGLWEFKASPAGHSVKHIHMCVHTKKEKVLGIQSVLHHWESSRCVCLSFVCWDTVLSSAANFQRPREHLPAKARARDAETLLAWLFRLASAATPMVCLACALLLGSRCCSTFHILLPSCQGSDRAFVPRAILGVGGWWVGPVSQF